MLIGMNKNEPATPKSSDGATIFDVTAKNFETAVLKASMQQPILIDFWAPWCGPCKQLMPALEKAVLARGGDVLLAKVNVDENPELSQAFRVQSVPTVIALYMGQPVSGFTGARPAADIEKLLEQLITLHKQNQPDAIDIPAAMKEAATFLDAGALGDAQETYARILMQEATNTEAYVGLIRVMIAAGDIAQAEDMIENAPEAVLKDSKFGAARTALELAQSAGEKGADVTALENMLKAQPNNLELWFELAEANFAAGRKDAAVDALVELIRKDRTWDDEKARKQLLKYFEAWGFSDPASVTGRRKLSTLLFS